MLLGSTATVAGSSPRQAVLSSAPLCPTCKLTKRSSCSLPEHSSVHSGSRDPSRGKDAAQDSTKRVWFWDRSHEGSYGCFWAPTLPGYPTPGAFLACIALKDPRNEADGDTGFSSQPDLSPRQAPNQHQGEVWRKASGAHLALWFIQPPHSTSSCRPEPSYKM